MLALLGCGMSEPLVVCQQHLIWNLFLFHSKTSEAASASAHPKDRLLLFCRILKRV